MNVGISMSIDLDELIAKHIYKGIDDAINELYIKQGLHKQGCVYERNYIKEKASKHIDAIMDSYFKNN